MAKQELLSKLKDVHLPAEAGWWPLAIGWWLLILLVILSLVALVTFYYRQRRQDRFSRHALFLLEQIESENNDDWLIELEVILKRTALSYFPKKQIAKLNQQAWINFLMQTGENVWNDESLSALRDYVYQEPSQLTNLNRELILQHSRQWLQQLPSQNKSIQAEAKHV